MSQRLAATVDRIDRAQRAIPPLAFAVGVVRKFANDRASKLAAVIAYYAFFSFFPVMLVVTTVLGRALASHPHLRDQLIDSALAQFPVIGTTLRDKDQLTPLSGSAFTLVAGVAGALWGGLRAMQVAQDAMNDVWDVPLRDRPNVVRLRLRALLTLLLVGGALLVTVGLSALATHLPVALAGRVALMLGTALADAATFLLAFRILTVARVTWRDLVPGALFAGVAWLLVQVLGAWFVDRTIRGASDVYGTFATVIGFLSLFYLQAQLALLAAEVNVVFARRLWPRSLSDRNLTDADRRVQRDEATSSLRHAGERVDVRFDR